MEWRWFCLSRSLIDGELLDLGVRPRIVEKSGAVFLPFMTSQRSARAVETLEGVPQGQSRHESEESKPRSARHSGMIARQILAGFPRRADTDVARSGEEWIFSDFVDDLFRFEH